MLQKFKITSYALIVGLVLVLPSQTIAESGYAKSCKGWNCSHDGQLCPQGAKGASDKSFICLNSQWVPTTCTERNIMDLYNRCVEITVRFGGARAMHECVGSLIQDDFLNANGCRY
jgi:hypothetical protein